MRAIHAVRLDEVRPAVLLTREVALPLLSGITVAPITSTVRGISTEVPVGPGKGLDRDSVINCDTVVTVGHDDVLGFLGYLTDGEDQLLLRALMAAYDLRLPPRRNGPPVPRARP